MEFLKIVLFCVLAACVYGVLHDQVTARVCVEYFTIGHVRVIDSDSPTVLGLVWGILATWWVGAILGCAIAASARAGSNPKLRLSDVTRRVLILLLVMGGCALLAGIFGYMLASKGSVFLLEPLASRVPREKHVAFLANLWAHSASYFVGFVGGVVLCVRMLKLRKDLNAA